MEEIRPVALAVAVAIDSVTDSIGLIELISAKLMDAIEVVEELIVVLAVVLAVAIDDDGRIVNLVVVVVIEEVEDELNDIF